MNKLLLQRIQEKEPGAPRPDEIEGVSALALEAQLREMSLGQLVGAIIEGAMTEGVSRMLDGGPSGNVAVASEAR